VGYRFKKTPGVVYCLCFLMDGESAKAMGRMNEMEMKACKVSVDISDK
jgi:hypothetical protein